MAKLALNKNALSREKQRRASFERYLPSLELKQKQLLAERKKAQQQLAEHRVQIESIEQTMRDTMPMLANQVIDVTGLVEIEEMQLDEENLLGTRLPRLGEVRCRVRDYGYLARPHWFDRLVRLLRQVIMLKLEEEVLEVRARRLEAASRTITQRVNLFSKVLIPEAGTNIKRIGLFLADQETAGVVRSKLAKKKQARRDGP